MVSAQDFVSEGDVDVRKLITTLFGSVVLAFYSGTIETIVTAVDRTIALIQAATNLAVSLVRVLFGAPGRALDQSFTELAAVVSSAGPLSFALSVSAALVLAYMTSIGVTSIVGE